MRIALMAPMKPELAPLVRKLDLQPRDHDGLRVHEATIDGIDVVATVSGIGTAAAIRATVAMLDAFAIDHALVVGIAGGVGPTVDIGDLVIPAVVLDGDGGAAYRPTLLGDGTPRGTIITSDQFGYEPDDIARFVETGVVGLDMETASIAAVCERRDTPWCAFRAISDRGDDDTVDAEVLEMAGADGGGDAKGILKYLVRKPWKIPHLTRLAKGSKLATERAADAAIDAIRAAAGTGR
ncbi:MAG TPA: 5'-methylthioadenosine/S-adenosylhomocysteine nucleosidase [Acidimicrobiia bacterium]|nr:5'-methylthioadenosine/S-adenosylhomocysteine nucleosidase [Acidimicrobiia bacterium]